MKRVLALLLCAVTLFMTSCMPSKEEKAEKLIKEKLKYYLYYPDSYEPITTIVDSMFIDMTTIEPIMEISDDIIDLISKTRSCEMQLENSEISMSIWAHNQYSSQYDGDKYERAQKENEKAKLNLEKCAQKLTERIASLKEKVAKYYKGEFTGWAVKHRFRCLDGSGSVTMPGDMIFFCDEEFSDGMGYEVYKIEAFGNILEVVNEATSDEEIIDYFEENSFLSFEE